MFGKKKNIIFIFGMSKSGTSFVASILHDIVDYQDKNLLAGKMDNVFGYFENVTMVEINEDLIKNAGTKWHPTEKPQSKLKFDKELRKKGDEFLKGLAKDSENIVLKDPRLVMTIPFWMEISKSFSQKLIFVFRHPLEVAMSVNKAADTEIGEALKYWEVVNNISLEFMKGKKVLMLNYNELMENPQDEILRIYKFLGLKPDTEKLAKQIFLAVPEVRHFKFDGNKDKIPEPVVKLYDKILDLYAKNKEEYNFGKDSVFPGISDEAKIKLLRDHIDKLDKIIRKQYDSTRDLAKEYLRMEKSNRFLAEENRKLAQMLEKR